MSFSIKVDFSGTDFGDLADAAEKAARPAAQAGAQVLYDRVKLNVSQIKPKTGNLARSIYQVYSADNSWTGRATYHISWNFKKAPHGYLVEYGHLQRYEVSHDPKTGRFITHKDRPLAQPKLIPGRPFLRPAMAAIPAAEAAMRERFWSELAKAGWVSA